MLITAVFLVTVDFGVHDAMWNIIRPNMKVKINYWWIFFVKAAIQALCLKIVLSLNLT
jgi:hypothetical protein